MVLEYTPCLDANHVKFICTIFPILERDSILILINIWILLVAADDKKRYLLMLARAAAYLFMLAIICRRYIGFAIKVPPAQLP